MEWFEAIILGIIQGLAEFLPISSSGHLIIGKELLGIENSENVVFETVVHAATVLSTITILWKEISNLFLKSIKFQWNDETQYLCKIAISMIPVLIVGLFFKDTVEALFGEGVILVGIMLLVTALLLALTKFVKFKERKDVGFVSALIIGLAQAVAVLPGLSRSGTTIATGLLLGNKKESIAQFSFLMVIVPVLGEALLNVKDVLDQGFAVAMNGISFSAILIGFLAAFITGCLACRWMINIVKKGKLIWFAVYCVVIGVIA